MDQFGNGPVSFLVPDYLISTTACCGDCCRALLGFLVKLMKTIPAMHHHPVMLIDRQIDLQMYYNWFDLLFMQVTKVV